MPSWNGMRWARISISNQTMWSWVLLQEGLQHYHTLRWWVWINMSSWIIYTITIGCRLIGDLLDYHFLKCWASLGPRCLSECRQWFFRGVLPSYTNVLHKCGIYAQMCTWHSYIVLNLTWTKHGSCLSKSLVSKSVVTLVSHVLGQSHLWSVTSLVSHVLGQSCQLVALIILSMVNWFNFALYTRCFRVSVEKASQATRAVFEPTTSCLLVQTS